MINKSYHIDEDQELRVQIKAGDLLKLQLLEGYAELYGAQLVAQRVYHLKALIQTVYPIHTWNGCVVLVSLEKEPPYAPYIAKRNPMPMYLNAHVCMENFRLNDKKGPTVMVTGSKHSGKNSLCKILSNYAVRDGKTPVFVDLDVAQNTISIPGTIGATIINCQTPVEDEHLSESSPLVYNFGTIKHDQYNRSFYKQIMSEMAGKIDYIRKSNSTVNTSGVIINTSTDIYKSGDYHLLLHTAHIFSVDVILVLDDMKMYNNFNHDLPFVNIAFLPKCDGIIELSSKEKQIVNHDKVRRYFYRNQPFNMKISFHKVKIYEIDSSKIYSVQPSLKHKNHLLAVSFASKKGDLLFSHIAGYVLVLAVDEETEMMTLLSPESELISNPLLILTDLIFSIDTTKKNT